MPDQDRPFDLEALEKLRKHDLRLVVQVARGSASAQRLGLAVSEARIDDGGKLRRPGDARREVAPHRDRAQSLVEEDERRPLRARECRCADTRGAATRH